MIDIHVSLRSKDHGAAEPGLSATPVGGSLTDFEVVLTANWEVWSLKFTGLRQNDPRGPVRGHERGFRDVRDEVRSISDSGKIAAQRTDVEGQEETLG